MIWKKILIRIGNVKLRRVYEGILKIIKEKMLELFVNRILNVSKENNEDNKVLKLNRVSFKQKK